MSVTLRTGLKRRVDRQGRDVVLVRKPTTNRDDAEPWQGKAATGDDDRTPVRAKFKSYKQHDIDGERVRQSDQRCLIAPADLDDVKPTTADQVEDDDGTIYAIIAVSEQRTGSSAHRYALQLRA